MHTMQNNQKLTIDPLFVLSINEILYDEPLTGRKLAKVYNHDNGLFYVLKEYDTAKNDPKEIQQEMISLNKQLHEPGIFPKCHVLKLNQNRCFLLMDWMEGRTLASVYRNPPQDHFDMILRLQIMLQLARAIQKIHQVRMIHRDLKPENILVINPKKPMLGVRIIDFGLASVKLSRNEGSLGFRSPEQEFRHAAVDQRSDIFSLGQLIFWSLAGRPFHGIPTLDEWDSPDFSFDMKGAKINSDEFFSKILAFHPKKRFESIRDVENALEKMIRSIKP